MSDFTCYRGFNEDNTIIDLSGDTSDELHRSASKRARESSSKSEHKQKRNRGDRAKKWCFTWNNYPENAEQQLLLYVQAFCERWAFQTEIGESGTPHVQGWIVYKIRQRMSHIRGRLGQSLHMEKQRALDDEAAYAYCLNPEKFSGLSYSVLTDPRRTGTAR